MIEVGDFRGKTIGVFGLARSAAFSAGAQVDNFEAWPWANISALILSPGVPLTHPAPHAVVRRAHEAGAQVIGDVELFARAIRPVRDEKGSAPVISITGTN